ncbi:hypothetical protein [Melioribacter sp. OK-6-Me]|uniref:hypothetical protein n=1 Tax=unclassified Melioribacter TaxID=2627329 RepID=UPI003EDA5372
MIKNIKTRKHKVSNILTAILYHLLTFLLFIDSVTSLLYPKLLFERFTKDLHIIPEIAFFAVTIIPLFILILSTLLCFKIKIKFVLISVLLIYCIDLLSHLILFWGGQGVAYFELLTNLVIILITSCLLTNYK